MRTMSHLPKGPPMIPWECGVSQASWLEGKGTLGSVRDDDFPPIPEERKSLVTHTLLSVVLLCPGWPFPS